VKWGRRGREERREREVDVKGTAVVPFRPPFPPVWGLRLLIAIRALYFVKSSTLEYTLHTLVRACPYSEQNFSERT
jgi:hypothetical protein